MLMENSTTETRTFVGETATAVDDGYAGFRIGQQYQLTYTKEFDEVRIVLVHHAHVSPGAGPLVLTSEQFEKRFVKWNT
jgi:hypothetical protein